MDGFLRVHVSLEPVNPGRHGRVVGEALLQRLAERRNLSSCSAVLAQSDDSSEGTLPRCLTSSLKDSFLDFIRFYDFYFFGFHNRNPVTIALAAQLHLGLQRFVDLVPVVDAQVHDAEVYELERVLVPPGPKRVAGRIRRVVNEPAEATRICKMTGSLGVDGPRSSCTYTSLRISKNDRILT